MICGLWEFACCMVSLIPLNQWKRREESLSNTMPIEQTFYQLIWVHMSTIPFIYCASLIWGSCLTLLFYFWLQILRRRLRDIRSGELRALRLFDGLRKLFKWGNFRMQSVPAVLMNVFGTMWQWYLAQLIPGRFLMLPQATVSKIGTLLKGAIDYV